MRVSNPVKTIVRPSQSVRNPYAAASERWDDYQPVILSDLALMKPRIQPADEVPLHLLRKPRYDPSDERIAEPACGQMTLRTMLPLIDLLMYLDVPLHRRFVQNVLTFQGRYSPVLVSRMVAAVESMSILDAKRRSLRVNGETNHLLYTGAITKKEIACIYDLIEYRQQVMRPDVLGPVAERFVRSCLKFSKQYSEVTPEARLGNVRDRSKKNAVDIFATEKATGVRYAISVKNVFEWLYPGSPSIKDIWNKAKEHGAKPWIIVPFATAEARKRCVANARMPIRLSALGAQILPSRIDGRSTRVLLRELAPVIGPQPFILHGARFDPKNVPSRLLESL
jgi:hypothetical protein